jgi:hypothetical protein
MPNELGDARPRGPSEHAIDGLWYNQHGSRIDLLVSENGAVQGTFRSPVGLSKGKDEALVLGFTSGDLLSFVANFGKYASLTAWTGHLVEDAGDNVLEMQWQMTVAIPGRASRDDLWRGIWTGSDTFQRQNPAQSSLSRRMLSHPLPEWP